MSIKGNEENKNSFVKTMSWWLILVPAVIGVRFLIVYGLKSSPPANSNSGFVKDGAVVAKEQSSEPAAPPTGAEMAAREWMQGVGKIWCNTPNNLPKGIVKSLEDASFEFVSTPEGLRFAEEKAGKLEEYIRATSQAKSNIALNKILNEICPQKLTAFTRQRVRQLREEGKID